MGVFISRLARNMSQSIRSFVRSVLHFGKSVFRSKALESTLLFDDQRKLFLLFRKTTVGNGVSSQELRVYS